MRRGFRPATRDSSSARAHTRKQPRACAAGRRHKPGARIARRRHAAGRLNGPSGRKPPADKGNARKAKGAKLSFSGVSVRGGTFGPTFYIFMEVWRGFLPGGLLPGHREQKLGFLPARENRSPALSPHPERTAGVRDAGKKETRCANCPPQVCPAQPRGRARHGEEKDRANRFAGIRHTRSNSAGDEPANTDSSAPGRRVRVVLTAGAGGNCPGSIRSRYGKSSGASCRRRCRCSRR